MSRNFSRVLAVAAVIAVNAAAFSQNSFAGAIVPAESKAVMSLIESNPAAAAELGRVYGFDPEMVRTQPEVVRNKIESMKLSPLKQARVNEMVSAAKTQAGAKELKTVDTAAVREAKTGTGSFVSNGLGFKYTAKYAGMDSAFAQALADKMEIEIKRGYVTRQQASDFMAKAANKPGLLGPGAVKCELGPVATGRMIEEAVIAANAASEQEMLTLISKTLADQAHLDEATARARTCSLAGAPCNIWGKGVAKACAAN